jgi:hypothetical protein
MSDNRVSPDPEYYIKEFEKLLVDPKTPRGPLWSAWHFLQVYSHWGLQIPYTKEALALQLGTTQPGSYAFFLPALEAYNSVHTACSYFLTDVFRKVVDLGNDLHQFAKDAGEKDGLLVAVVNLLDANDNESALTLIKDLRSKAEKNEGNARTVGTNLATYKTQLIGASGQLKLVDEEVEKDAKTQQATINKLTSTDPECAGSLAQISKFIKMYQENYEQYVIIASTTPTYAWVVWPVPPLPLGLIAASVVAGIYGTRAREALEELRKWQGHLEKANKELQAAVTAHAVQSTAHTGLNGASILTDKAIGHTTTVQNSWNGLARQVQSVEESLEKMMQGDRTALAQKPVIKAYLTRVRSAWEKIVPPLKELTDNPYITIWKGKINIDQLIAQLGPKG